jgi:MarR family transcriptional regulator, lower aerobic nicotinate degradation pathway regulator
MRMWGDLVADWEKVAAEIKKYHTRPGFLLWRAHHIAASVFSDECGKLGITSPQYSALWAVKVVPRIDQMGVSRLIGHDRFTTAMVLSTLTKRRLIVRERDSTDRRRYSFRISPRGRRLLQQARRLTARGRSRLLAPFTPRERRTFIALLTRFVVALNKDARARIDDAALPAIPRRPRR